MKKEISTINGMKILGQVLPPMAFSMLTGLIALSPEWSSAFILTLGVVQVWGKFGQVRINELVQFIDEHKEEYIKEILETDKFKSIFLNVVERHTKEVYEEKRKMLRNYLLNVGKGINKEFNYHTKILWILDQITLDEVEVLNAIYEYAKKQPSLNEFHLSSSSLGFSKKHGDYYLRRLLNSLSSYGLITISDATMGPDTAIKQFSDIGEIFLQFIVPPNKK